MVCIYMIFMCALHRIVYCICLNITACSFAHERVHLHFCFTWFAWERPTVYLRNHFSQFLWRKVIACVVSSCFSSFHVLDSQCSSSQFPKKSSRNHNPVVSLEDRGRSPGHTCNLINFSHVFGFRLRGFVLNICHIAGRALAQACRHLWH